MFNKKTVFVLGAGASAEFGMPTGYDLKRQIAQILTTNNSEQSTSFRAALMRTNEDWRQLLEAGQHLISALPSFVSIDEALHYLSDDSNAVAVGKSAIGYLLLRHETASRVSFDDRRGRVEPGRWGETWLSEFLSIALSFARRNDAERLFENVTIINFNYDRVIEQYLVHALQHVGRLTRGQAETIVDNMRVIRPYGALGKLPWQKRVEAENPPIEFGLDITQHPWLKAVGTRIQTYTEQLEDPQKNQAIQNAMHTAQVIVFIGFGFHQQNMKLLQAAPTDQFRTVFATASGIDRENYDLLEGQLRVSFSAREIGMFDKLGVKLMQDLRPIIAAAVS